MRSVLIAYHVVNASTTVSRNCRLVVTRRVGTASSYVRFMVRRDIRLHRLATSQTPPYEAISDTISMHV